MDVNGFDAVNVKGSLVPKKNMFKEVLVSIVGFVYITQDKGLIKFCAQKKKGW